METAVYYTFSTISQTLGSAIALLAAFVLYRLQLSNAEIQAIADDFRTRATGNLRVWMEKAYFAGDPEKVLDLASTRDQGGITGLGDDQVRASQERLRDLRMHRATLVRRFGVSLLLTVVLIGFSMLALSITPRVEKAGISGELLSIGLLWSWLCLASYVLVVKSALAGRRPTSG